MRKCIIKKCIILFFSTKVKTVLYWEKHYYCYCYSEEEKVVFKLLWKWWWQKRSEVMSCSVQRKKKYLNKLAFSSKKKKNKTVHDVSNCIDSARKTSTPRFPIHFHIFLLIKAVLYCKSCRKYFILYIKIRKNEILSWIIEGKKKIYSF